MRTIFRKDTEKANLLIIDPYLLETMAVFQINAFDIDFAEKDIEDKLKEMYKLIKETRLTRKQRRLIRLYLSGNTLSDISRITHMAPASVFNAFYGKNIKTQIGWHRAGGIIRKIKKYLAKTQKLGNRSLHLHKNGAEGPTTATIT
jgi:DNA-binding CsgD family transcriptional regulator